MERYIEAVKTAEIISEKLSVPLGDLVDIFAEIPNADVVPKNEHEKAIEVIKEVNRLAAEVKADIPLLVKQTKTEVAREILSNLKREIHDKAVYPGGSIPFYVQLRVFDAVINDFIKKYCEETRK